MLGLELSDSNAHSRPYIPPHFPALPSRHAWISTPVYTQREKDGRKIRERATQEGILAEQALRKLTAVNKARSRTRGTAGQAEKSRELLWQDMLAEVTGGGGQGDTQKDADGDLVFDGAGDDRPGVHGVHVKAADGTWTGEGMEVNYDQGRWRRGGTFDGIRT